MRWLDPESEHEIWLVPATSLDEWPAYVPWTAPFCTLFVATDRAVDARPLALRALEQGLAAVAAWGPNCGEIEGTFDEVIVDETIRRGRDETVDDVILTTSHAGETLAEALDFFLDVLFPPDAHATRTRVILAVGDAATQIEPLLVSRRARRFSD